MKWTIHQDRCEGETDIDCYTITLKEGRRGWNTDSGARGYGLPKELAQWICDILNKSGEDCPYTTDGWEWEKSIIKRKKEK